MVFEKISVAELRDYIYIAFSGDSDLLNKYHISPGTLDHCTDHTFETIKSSAYQLGLSCFSVWSKGVPIGFTVIGKYEDVPMLYSFGLNIKYRKFHPHLNTWWNTVYNTMLSQWFVCVLHTKNVRAINFLTKNGMKMAAVDEEKTILHSHDFVNFKSYETCQLQQQQQ